MSAGDLVSGEITTPRTIETEEFYDLMQAYRFADAANQIVVADRFGAIVDHVDAKLAAHDDLVKALEGVIRVADRATDEFDAARAALAKATAK